jgi:hypothetical protein
MNRKQMIAERKLLVERITFLDACMNPPKKIKPDAPYGCQQYSADLLCRFDRRAIDRKCDGCKRVTDRAYLESMGLWVDGVSHESA